MQAISNKIAMDYKQIIKERRSKERGINKNKNINIDRERDKFRKYAEAVKKLEEKSFGDRRLVLNRHHSVKKMKRVSTEAELVRNSHK